MKDHDPVNHPSHYTAYKGLEVIDLTEQMNFNRGNAVKYICRAGLKDKANEIQDLKKGVWYLNREINRILKFEENRTLSDKYEMLPKFQETKETPDGDVENNL